MISINKQLTRLYHEDIIWYIYFFIIFFYLYSNHLEELYIQNKDIKLKKKFRKINKIVFFIVLIIYIYFLIVNIDKVQELDNNSTYSQRKITYLSLIISILFVIAGVISLYLSFESETLDNEIAFI